MPPLPRDPDTHEPIRNLVHLEAVVHGIADQFPPVSLPEPAIPANGDGAATALQERLEQIHTRSRANGLPSEEAHQSTLPSLEPRDLGRIASDIAAQAPNDPYQAQNARQLSLLELRGEDPGAEQTGLKQVDLPVVVADDPEMNADWHAEQRRRPRAPRTVRPVRGPARGESEVEITPAGHERDELLTSPEKAAGHVALGAIRHQTG